jgi:hypothetical protein
LNFIDVSAATKKKKSETKGKGRRQGFKFLSLPMNSSKKRRVAQKRIENADSDSDASSDLSSGLSLYTLHCYRINDEQVCCQRMQPNPSRIMIKKNDTF